MIYLDHNASTPVRPEVADAMHAALRDLSANPSSSHREGQRARGALERAREQVAALVRARPEEVVFVSGGTEGDHLALVGAALARKAAGRRVACAAIEHHAVHGAVELLAELGFEHATLPCGADGRTDPMSVDALSPDTTVVSLMLANNETGVIQPVGELAARAHARGLLVHCDAVQAAGKVPVEFGALDVDYLVVSGHKFGGPKGAGALIVRRGAPLAPLARGTAHERGRRGGTENVPGIVGLGLAAELAAAELDDERARLTALRGELERGLAADTPDVVVHGRSAPRLPNTVSASFPGTRADHLLLALDARGVAVSAGAACASGAVEPSPVLAAMGVPRALAIGALRFSLGRTTTADELARARVVVAEAVRVTRGGSPAQARA
ncbi:MAG TPA: cysteine desulfurase family protein [Candidatus Acidoferrales bacterium]|nr:cysteine desulfurase family protein [Candidatus Acidoferrales bacterium]